MLDQRINADTARFAVLGKQLGHTWSPVIHNSVFTEAKRNAVYFPVTVPEDALKTVCDVFRSCFSGFNVTIPYKERIIPLLDEVDDAVRACGAVNTVEVKCGRLIGHITDGIGMLRAIKVSGVSTNKRNVLILGGGGAARVAAYEFLARGGYVTLAVRDKEKGKRLAHELSLIQPDSENRICVCSLDSIVGTYDILVNCTPVGMYPNVDACPVTREVVSRCASVFDAIYNPRETRLMSFARAEGITAIEGLGMLYYQAIEAQKIWFDGNIGVSDLAQKQIYQELLAQMK